MMMCDYCGNMTGDGVNMSVFVGKGISHRWKSVKITVSEGRVRMSAYLCAPCFSSLPEDVQSTLPNGVIHASRCCVN